MEHLIRTIKKVIKDHKDDLGNNLLSKGVDNIDEFKRVYVYAQGLDKALNIINEVTEKYKKGSLEEDD